MVDQKFFEKELLNELDNFTDLQRSTFLLKYQENFGLPNPSLPGRNEFCSDYINFYRFE